jgi:hypothetical protein
VTARDNPFASRRIERLRLRFSSGDGWNTLLHRLEMHRWRGAIVGPHGAGKTTLLEQIAPRLRAIGFQPWLITLREGATPAEFKRVHCLAAANSFVLLDGAEQLPWSRWICLRWTLRNAAGLLISQHEAGRLPTLLEMRPTAELLTELTNELVPGGIDHCEARRLLQKHRGNVRECFRELYDHTAMSAERIPTLLR